MNRRPRRVRSGIFGVVVLAFVSLLALTANWTAGYSPTLQDLAARLQPPGTVANGHLFPLGTDGLGRDVWARIAHGSQVSLTVAAVAVGISLLVGTSVGVVAAMRRGFLGAALMRAVDVVLAIPFLLLAVATVAVLGPSFSNIMVALGLARWPRYARIGYAQTLTTRELEFIQAARAVGVPERRVILRHILPNVAPALIVVATLEMGLMIIFEASLSFLGLGVQPPDPSWGGMLSEGRNYLADAWWLATFPGLAITVTVLGANMAGDHVRDRLDPRRGEVAKI